VQRVPLGPGRGQVAPPVANAVNARAPLIRSRVPAITAKRATRVVAPPVVLEEEDVRLSEPQSEMDIEEDTETNARVAETEASLQLGEREVEAMIGVQDSEEEEELDETTQQPPVKIQRIWPEVSTERKHRYQKEVQTIREMFEEEVDMYDTTMVSEYAEEIFEYMCDLEVRRVFLVFLILAHEERVEGGDDAEPQLYGRPERDHLGDASNTGRLVAASPPPLSYVARDPLDRCQHRRPVPN
jgi:hypothetical protein